MKITVIICTYNRCDSLLPTLESLALSRVPAAHDWEVIVVDNNSKDRTREVVEAFCARHPRRFRYHFERQQGLSSARNSGVNQAAGDILVFTDDDVLVEPTWLEKLTAPLIAGECSGVAGKILPAPGFVCPDWLALAGDWNQGGVLALFDPGASAGETKTPPFGANMAFRRDVFQRYGLFRTDLGRKGDNAMSNEDTEFGRRLIAGCARLWYQPSAVVYHSIAENRVEKRYFLKFAYEYGRSQARESSNRSSVWIFPRWFFSVPMILLRVIPPRVATWWISSDPKRRFFFQCVVWKNLGEVSELPRIWLDERRRKKAPRGQTAELEIQSTSGSLGKLGSSIENRPPGVS
jgi:glycosyltransferase involved in cell wall biosynthesis